MYNFKKLSEVPAVEEASADAKVIMEQDGEIVRGPAPTSGGTVMITYLDTSYFGVKDDESLRAFYGIPALTSGLVSKCLHAGETEYDFEDTDFIDENGSALQRAYGDEIYKLANEGKIIAFWDFHEMGIGSIQWDSISEYIEKGYMIYGKTIPSITRTNGLIKPGFYMSGEEGNYCTLTYDFDNFYTIKGSST